MQYVKINLYVYYALYKKDNKMSELKKKEKIKLQEVKQQSILKPARQKKS